MKACAFGSDFCSSALTFDACNSCEYVASLKRASRESLYAEAVARGADYFRPFANGVRRVADLALVPHEALGCALLAGPEIGATFHSIQVGAMILSDLNNDPAVMADCAVEFEVTFRLMALAEIAMRADDNLCFWQATRQALKARGCYCTDSFIPGRSRLISKTDKRWLRTSYSHPFVAMRVAV